MMHTVTAGSTSDLRARKPVPRPFPLRLRGFSLAALWRFLEETEVFAAATKGSVRRIYLRSADDARAEIARRQGWNDDGVLPW